jgi:hypothetical protein
VRALRWYRRRGLVRIRVAGRYIWTRRPKGGCRFANRAGYECRFFPKVRRSVGLLCRRHSDLAYRLRKKYGSVDAIPDFEFSIEGLRRRLIRGQKSARLALRRFRIRLDNHGVLLSQATKDYAKAPDGGCRFHRRSGYFCHNRQRRGRQIMIWLMCVRHYSLARRLASSGRYDSIPEVPDYEFSEASYRHRRLFGRWPA